MPNRRRRRRLALFALLAVVVLVWWCGRPAPLTLGTFNIRVFPDTQTRPEAVAAALAELDVDAFAVQEIRDVELFTELLRNVGAGTGREYAAVMVPYCPRSEFTRTLSLGVVYDARRFTLISQRPLAGAGACARDQPHGMVALLRERDGKPLALASVHMKAGGDPSDLAARRRQWTWLLAALPGLRRLFDAPVVIAGDFNSTGYLRQGSDERRFIDHAVASHGLQLPTGALDCSEYWLPKGSKQYAVSLLDHVLAPAQLPFAATEVLGMCAALQCAPQSTAPPGFDAVSDHCPVRVTLGE